MSNNSSSKIKTNERGYRWKRQDVTPHKKSQKTDSTINVQNNVESFQNDATYRFKVSTNEMSELRVEENSITTNESKEQAEADFLINNAVVTKDDTVDIAKVTTSFQASSKCSQEETSSFHNESTKQETNLLNTNDSALSMQLANVLQISPNCESELENMEHNFYIDGTENILDKTFSSHISNLSVDQECIEDTAEILPSWQQQEGISNSNQADVNKKVIKTNKQTRTKKIKKTHVAMDTDKLNIEKEVQEENCHNSKQEIINFAIKGINDPKKTGSLHKSEEIFLDYIPVSQMMEILNNQSSDNIQYIKGNLRINPKFYKHSYLSMEDGKSDLLIIGLCNRNCAFEGDEVVARINSEKDWHTLPCGQIQRTGVIVCILKEVHPRIAIGYLKQQNSMVFLQPRDQRIPLIKIHPRSIPYLYRNALELCKNVMFLVNIYFWKKSYYALGKILYKVGKSGEINAEISAILLENNLDISPYREDLLKGLPSVDYVLTDNDLKDREDWRHECIFTIDPATAVDLDDAVSCKIMDNGNYEIGVHISDVTHYLKFLSPLDIEVSKRATTVYLPHKNYHMLPKELCQVCSLLPGKDKLAFSVIWEMTPDSQIVKHHFAKTIIRSCCQMSYDNAQAMIDNPEKLWPKDFLNIQGNYTTSSLSLIVNHLYKLSVKLRNKRFANGALRLDQPKLHVYVDTSINSKNATSVNYYLEEKKESNSLIEEFMLLANMTVATQLHTTIPKTALLRIHKGPSTYMLSNIYNKLQKYGIHIDIETAGSLHASIERYMEQSKHDLHADNNIMKYITMVIINLCSRTMTRAEYICTSIISSSDDLRHYALNVPFYTHFTSPIRRYADCIVHRLLYATMENKPLPEKWTTELCSTLANNCNVKKYSAKLAQEQSTEMYFAYMISCTGNYQCSAIVLDVQERNVDVILCDIGVKLRIYLANIKDDTATIQYNTQCSVPTVTITWKEPAVIQVINVFTLVCVRLTQCNKIFRLKADLLPPEKQ